MSALVRCPRCSRHVFADAEACPFCAREAGSGRAATKVALSVATASAVMLASMGCAYGMPDTHVDAGDDADADAHVDAGSDARTPADATTADASDAGDGADAD
jgi:hypothetical protein